MLSCPPGLYPLSLAAEARSRRRSSYDRAGGNVDFCRLPAGGSVTLLDTGAAGMVTHLWFALAHFDPNYLRRLVLRAWWDGEPEPSVQCPLGDFFGVGHAVASKYESLPLNMVRGEGHRGESTGMNCYLAMPFHRGARVEVVNESPLPCMACYYQLDWLETSPAVVEPYGTFHASWTRQCPTPSVKVDVDWGLEYGRFVTNLSDRDNFPVVAVRGTGQFLGMNLSVDNVDPEVQGHPLNAFGEGDEMIFLDDEPWPPSLHGTGTEDYFTDAWGMSGHAGLYAGVSYATEATPEGRRQCGTCYRFHLPDPIFFREALRFSIEHGHANLQANDLAATAYWYQREPHAPWDLLPVEARLPVPQPGDLPPQEEAAAALTLGELVDVYYRIFMWGSREQVRALSRHQVASETLGKAFELQALIREGATNAAAVETAMAPYREALASLGPPPPADAAAPD